MKYPLSRPLEKPFSVGIKAFPKARMGRASRHLAKRFLTKTNKQTSAGVSQRKLHCSTFMTDILAMVITWAAVRTLHVGIHSNIMSDGNGVQFAEKFEVCSFYHVY